MKSLTAALRLASVLADRLDGRAYSVTANTGGLTIQGSYNDGIPVLAAELDIPLGTRRPGWVSGRAEIHGVTVEIVADCVPDWVTSSLDLSAELVAEQQRVDALTIANAAASAGAL